MPREERYARAEEFHDVVVDLWDSCAEDAFPENKATGQWLDPARGAAFITRARTSR